jgi:AraC-like DNA-binding protein
MAGLIQKTWMNRLLASSRWRELCEDFHELTGLALDWLPPDGRCHKVPVWMESSLLAHWLYEIPKGRRYYARLWTDLCETQPKTMVERVCDASLMHLVVPIWYRGSWVGSLFVGGYRVGAYDLETRNRLRHFFDRLGLVEDPAQTSALIEGVRCLNARFHRAIRNYLQDATVSLVHLLEARSSDSVSRPLPRVVSQVCQWIQRNFEQSLTLSEAAAIAGMNESYFCRLFRTSTGLRFIDYVNEVRLNEARHRLMDPSQRIADIAFASGFGSLSQFNRAFIRSNNCNPRTWRMQRHKVHTGSQT